MKNPDNGEVAGIFYRIADMLEMLGVQWKPRAYRAAAAAIENLGKPLAEIYSIGGTKALEEIPGVGEAIAKKIGEIIRTGKLGYLEELKKSLPVNLDELETMPNMGPKRIMALYRGLGIRNIDDLRKAAEENKIAKLRGFNEKTEKGILQALSQKKAGGGRMPLETGLPIAEKIVSRMKRIRSVENAEVAGSIRRKRPVIGDVDILVATKKPEIATRGFVSMQEVKRILARGETRSSVALENGMQVDLRVIRPEQWGSALMYFTGSKAHNVALRRIAKKKGLKLNEYGAFKGKKIVASRTEQEVYNALGMDYIEPGLRENEGEVEEAIKRFEEKKKSRLS